MQKSILFALIIVFGFSYISKAQGDLLITPTRVIFDGSKQKETLNLVNTGNKKATYSISFLQYRMNEDGSFTAITKADTGQMFADPYLRIFPRVVTLNPGEPQAIMMQYRRKPNMKDGEYRSHLYFRSEKNSDPLGMQKTDDPSKDLQVKLVPIFGLSIPVIIRYGEVNVSSTLSNLSLDLTQIGSSYMKFTINRMGNISLYGDIHIYYVPTKGKSYEIGIVKGVGVYTDLNKRNIIVKLNIDPEKPLTDGVIKVKYVNVNSPRKAEYASGELKIGSAVE